jgi:hypothetical protein
MPILSTGSAAITDLAASLAAQLSESPNAARAAVGDRSAAFAWTEGAVRAFPASVFSSMLVEGLTYRSTIVAPSATPATKVAAGALKPTAVTITSSTEQLSKYAGLAECNVEDIIDSAGLGAAIESTLIGQSLLAFCADIALELAGAARSATGPTWTEAILAAIGTMPWAQVLVVSPSDLAAIVSPGGSGFTLSMADAVPSVLGLALVILPTLAAGTAYVCASSALTLFESSKSPAVLVDPYSKADTNVVRIVSDLFAAAQLTSPGDACAVTVAP